MADEALESLAINVGDQSFRVRVPSGEVERCRRGEKKVNDALRAAIEHGAMPGPRAWSMAAFELAVELEELRDELARNRQGGDRLSELIRRIDSVTTKKTGE